MKKNLGEYKAEKSTSRKGQHPGNKHFFNDREIDEIPSSWQPHTHYGARFRVGGAYRKTEYGRKKQT